MAKNIIYYDGECGLCHGAVKFILGIDSKNKFHFSPISNLMDNDNEIDSIILKMNDDTFYEGKAFINIMETIGSHWYYIAQFLKFIPIKILNKIYRWISQNRSKLSSKKQSACPNIPIHLKRRFIFK
jgi:predicted DCC family thiol-disulfide oxidoreductase YuxK